MIATLPTRSGRVVAERDALPNVTPTCSSPIADYLDHLYNEIAGVTDGNVATYIPELAKADPKWFGICLVTSSGHIYEVGDSLQPFTIQSISKPFVYGLALEDHGRKHVLSKVSTEQVTLDYLELGPALLELGDLKGYERFRQEGIARFAGTSYPVADRIIKINLLLPADEAMINSLLPQVEVAEKTFAVVEESASPDVFQAAWRSVSLALLEYRRGDYAKSANWSRRCLAYPERNAPRSATAHVILAMSCWQLGQKSEAEAELGQGREMIESKFKNQLDRGSGVQGFWFDWVFAKILLREAKGLILTAP